MIWLNYQMFSFEKAAYTAKLFRSWIPQSLPPRQECWCEKLGTILPFHLIFRWLYTSYFHLKLSLDGNWKVLPRLPQPGTQQRAGISHVCVKSMKCSGQRLFAGCSCPTSIAATLSAATELKVCVPYSPGISRKSNHKTDLVHVCRYILHDVKLPFMA